LSTDRKLVWTTDPEEAKRLRQSGKLESPKDVEPSSQSIRVAIDRKRRAGKTVTVASGFQHTTESLARLTTRLKKRCGSGGTARDSEIEIQGDHLSTVANELAALGYRVKR
jgi:translation initiation factor 1